MDSGVSVFKVNISHLDSLRTPNILGRLLELCASIHDKLVGLQEDAISRWMRALASILRLIIHSASPTEFPHSLSPEGCTPDLSDLKWLPAFLRTLCNLSGKQSSALGEDEVQHAAADAFLLVARGGGIDPTDEDELLATFDWVLGLPLPTKWSPAIAQTPILRLRETMIRAVDAMIRAPGHSSHFISRLSTHHILALASVVTHPTQSLSKFNSEDSKALYERDKAFIATLLSLTPESSARESWLNDPTNDAYVRAWAHIVHWWLIPRPSWLATHSRIGKLSVVSLLACTRLCQATAADWGDDLACVQRVAVVAVWREWDAWYNREKVPEDSDALVERTRTIMELDAQSAVDVAWYIDDTRDSMESIQERDSAQAQQLQFPAVISALRQKVVDITALKNRAPTVTSQHPDPNSEPSVSGMFLRTMHV